MRDLSFPIAETLNNAKVKVWIKYLMRARTEDLRCCGCNTHSKPTGIHTILSRYVQPMLAVLLSTEHQTVVIYVLLTISISTGFNVTVNTMSSLL